MKVELLQDIIQDGKLKVSLRKTRATVPFVKGAIVEVSDATGAKWIAAQLAQAYVESKEPATDEGASS